jgi:hypothetical protein
MEVQSWKYIPYNFIIYVNIGQRKTSHLDILHRDLVDFFLKSQCFKINLPKKFLDLTFLIVLLHVTW